MRLSRFLRHLRRQDGITLVMAIGILGVLTLSGTTMIYYSDANARSAQYSKANSSAYDYAEAGMNEMLAILNKPENNALKPDLLPATTHTYDNGSVTWSGTLDATAQTWSLTSIGSLKNPTGATKNVTRKLTAKVPVVPSVTQPLNNPAWNYMFATHTGSTCDETLNNNVGGGSRLYVLGNLCLGNNANLAPSTLAVIGNLSLDNNTSVGTSARRVETYIGKDCVYGQSATPNNTAGSCHNRSDSTLTSSYHIYGNYVNGSNQTVTGVGQSGPNLAIPTADFDKWYTNALPGPTQGCTTSSGTPPTFDNDTVHNNSLGNSVQDLTPATSYTCRVGPSASNDATTLAQPITSTSQTTITVSSATGFPTYGTFTIRVDNEYMLVTSGQGTTTWTVQRAQQGTTAVTHSAGASVTHVDPATGEISWNATTKTLTVSGTIFIDGSAKIANGALNQYDGQATIYLAGSLYINGKMCGGVSGSNCDFNNWNPNTEMLTFVTERAGAGGLVAASDGIQFANSASFQGALYAQAGNVEFGNNANSDGPIVGSQIILSNNVTTNAFGTVVTVPNGMPGNPTVYAQPNPPQLYAG